MAHPFGMKSFASTEPKFKPKFRALSFPSLSWLAGKTRHQFLQRDGLSNKLNWRRSKRTAPRPVTVSATKLEQLEPRYLLSADLMPLSVEMTGTDGNAFTLSYDDQAQLYQIYDDDTGELVDQRSLQEIGEIQVLGSSGNDRLTINVSDGFMAALPIFFDGQGGDDEIRLVGSGMEQSVLRALDQSSGVITQTLAGQSGLISFSGVESVSDLSEVSVRARGQRCTDQRRCRWHLGIWQLQPRAGRRYRTARLRCQRYLQSGSAGCRRGGGGDPARAGR